MLIQENNTIILPSIWLTIGIPTFKKPECLLKCLNSIFDNLPNEYRNRVEIIVVDNDDQHSAKSICDNFAIECTYIYGNYDIRTAESSISIIESKSNGLYVWYLGDDDYIHSSLVSVFDLFKYRPDVILLSYYNLSLRLIYLINKFSPVFLSRNIIKFLLHYRLGFISMHIFSRKLDKRYSINNDCRQMSFLKKSLSIVSNSNNISILQSPLFFDSPTASFYTAFDYFNVFYLQVLSALRSYPITKVCFLIWSTIYFRLPVVSGKYFIKNLPLPLFKKFIFFFFIAKSLFIRFLKSFFK